MSNIIKNRSELLFCYDIADANPNGDPLDNNKPRIDEETGINIVTDVRLKRTVRDYFFNYCGYNGKDDKDIFVRELPSEKGKGIKDGKARAKDFKADKDKILQKCIDIRLFGGVIPLEKDSITLTGPVQFRMGRSMHKVEIKYIKGTGAFASVEGKQQATFREEYILPYSFINFYGIINENAATYSMLSDDDAALLLKGMWEGTKNLISRSKFGQTPRLLIKINYKEAGYFIGDINKKIKLVSDIREEQIRSVKDFYLDCAELLQVLEEKKDTVTNIEYLIDPLLQLKKGDKEIKIDDFLKGKMTEIVL